MSLENLLEDIDERDDKGSLAIDGDSLLFLSCYRYRDNFNLELAYFDFAGRIKQLESELYKRVNEVEDVVICLTSSTNFRYEIYPEYKDNRKKTETDDSKALKDNVKELKRLIYSRIKDMCFVSSIVEADDSVVMYSHKGYYVCAIDSDVVNQCVTPVFNFHSKHWKWEHEGLYESDIFLRVLYESMMGKSKDNVPGISKCGKVCANKHIQSIKKCDMSFQDYVELFPLPEDMLLNYRLCDCSQYKNGKLELATIESIADKFTEYACPF